MFENKIVFNIVGFKAKEVKHEGIMEVMNNLINGKTIKEIVWIRC